METGKPEVVRDEADYFRIADHPGVTDGDERFFRLISRPLDAAMERRCNSCWTLSKRYRNEMGSFIS